MKVSEVWKQNNKWNDFGLRNEHYKILRSILRGHKGAIDILLGKGGKRRCRVGALLPGSALRVIDTLHKRNSRPVLKRKLRSRLRKVSEILARHVGIRGANKIGEQDGGRLREDEGFLDRIENILLHRGEQQKRARILVILEQIELAEREADREEEGEELQEWRSR